MGMVRSVLLDCLVEVGGHGEPSSVQADLALLGRWQGNELGDGTPLRAMTISSPAATRRKRREMWFLVSLIETYFMLP